MIVLRLSYYYRDSFAIVTPSYDHCVAAPLVITEGFGVSAHMNGAWEAEADEMRTVHLVDGEQTKDVRLLPLVAKHCIAQLES